MVTTMESSVPNTRLFKMHQSEHIFTELIYHVSEMIFVPSSMVSRSFQTSLLLNSLKFKKLDLRSPYSRLDEQNI